MWRILLETELAPPSKIRGAEDDALMPEAAGIGFTDLGTGVPGTLSSSFSDDRLHSWVDPLYERLLDQAARAKAPPCIVAFSGKRQFTCLFRGRKRSREPLLASARAQIGPYFGAASQAPFSATRSAWCPATIDPGPQRVLPQDWPLRLETTQVWVCSSTSGAAALTRADRFGPWERLAAEVSAIPWPLVEADEDTPATGDSTAS
ncbi:hypothetical protein H632_c106p1 [Helicosporidium sp. ATCC 50920]|nr:hypothetical protein H632_c106p1 [Helicosporidium sp. ATCC 50920]|eukprot:KDD76782.1 hypothetical protein H632_c106p1 [Helicosporidium sp. ATCC 50920]